MPEPKPSRSHPAGIQIVNLREAYNIEDLRRLARRRLPRVAHDFLDGGSRMALVARAALPGLRCAL